MLAQPLHFFPLNPPFPRRFIKRYKIEYKRGGERRRRTRAVGRRTFFFSSFLLVGTRCEARHINPVLLLPPKTQSLTVALSRKKDSTSFYQEQRKKCWNVTVPSMGKTILHFYSFPTLVSRLFVQMIGKCHSGRGGERGTKNWRWEEKGG